MMLLFKLLSVLLPCFSLFCMVAGDNAKSRFFCRILQSTKINEIRNETNQFTTSALRLRMDAGSGAAGTANASPCG